MERPCETNSKFRVPGWGFDRYILRKLGPIAGTLMAVDPNAPKVERFISLGVETIVGYNSRLPVVVYVPAGVEVRYRLWRAGPTWLIPPDERRQADSRISAPQRI